jgi:HAD superfamily hydrolase (TIGR01509 family)
MIERLGLLDTAETLHREYVAEVLPRLVKITPSPGAVDLVEELSRSGLRLAVASSSPRRVVDRVLAKLGLARAFAVVVSGDDVAAGKPAPDIFLLAAARLRPRPANCLVIEDSPNGLEAARRAGMGTVAVRTAYIPSDLLSADLIVDTIEELLSGRS